MTVQKATRWILALAPAALLAAGAEPACGAEDADGEFTIAFRLGKWKSMHFDDAAMARQHLATVKRIGCEARQENHGGHTDVNYRCTEWKTMALGSVTLVPQWKAWLQQAGFETLHGHDAAQGHAHSHHGHQPGTQREEVTYRLTRQSNQHFDRPEEAEQFLAIVKALGCEAVKSRHGNHIDVSFRCADWKCAEFPSHDAAHGWETWLKAAGFETRHSH